MNKITVKLQGGLGNYLFQIALAYAYSLKNNKKLFLDNSNTYVVHKKIESYFDNILENSKTFFDSVDRNGNYKIVKETGFKYNDVYLNDVDGDVIFEGYFQSERYFKDQRKEILNLFSFNETLQKNILKDFKERYNLDVLNENCCSIHIRRGDYLNHPDVHISQNMNYYMKAIKQMPKDSKFIIFSDDINWCKENFPNIEDKFFFVQDSKDYEDLFLMSQCKNNIIANSTFSWWGAWLNNNSEKIVVAPSVWFGPNGPQDYQDIYCENWFKI